MKKFFALALSLALALTAFAGCSSTSASTSTPSAASGSTAGSAGTAASGELNLYTWEGMFPQEVLDAFTAETGIKVNYSSFDTDETMLAKLETAKGGDYDVVIADDYIIETAIAEGLVMELDKSKIANIGNVNPVYQGQFFDPEDAYTVPYGAGVQTIVYNPDLVDIEINGYEDLWDAALESSLGITSNFRVMNGMALKIAGESYNTEDVAAIEAARAAGDGRVVLVDGVTGSGKTEVYLQAIERTLAEGRRAIVLVPEISLTPQTVARFRGRFGDAVAVMHSRMSDGERYDQWDFIKSGAAKVVVGARSALFTPAANVGLIVIDEEHEGSYKQDSSPRYRARDVAEWMMARAGGALVLGSATPSIEALYQVNKNPRWTAAALPERANGRPMPAIEVVDMAAEFASGSRAMFSGRLARALGEELAQGRKAVLLLNQRGFAKFLLCRDCGFVPECPHCSTSLTYHEQGAKLVCHHCGYAVAAPPTCPECGSPYLKKFGAGTQRVETELRQLLDGLPGVGPTVPIIRMDADTTQAKGAHQALLESFAAADAAVLLGTQMIAKGLDFDDVTLVGVINADTQLHLPDYRAGERTFQLIEQVAGRAGRAELDGRVMVQTYEADDVAIRAAATYNRGMFLRAELPKRKLLGYPPYVRMANVLLWGADEHAVATEAELLHAQLAELIRNEVGERWRVLPAVPCVLAKLRNTYRYHIVVKAPLGDDLSAPLVRLFRARKVNPAVNAAVDIDPMDLL